MNTRQLVYSIALFISSSSTLFAQPTITQQPDPFGGVNVLIDLEAGKMNTAEIKLQGAFFEFVINGKSYLQGQSPGNPIVGVWVAGKDSGNHVVFSGNNSSQPGLAFYGGAADDIVTNNSNCPMYANGGFGNDQITGGNGVNMFRFDTLVGGPGNDIIDGRGGNDRIYGESGNDILKGGPGNDFINGGLGQDTMMGGDHDDTIVDNHDPWFSGLTGVPDKEVDIIYGGNGKDRILHRHYGSRINVFGWFEYFLLDEDVRDFNPAEDHPLEEKNLSWAELEYLFPQNAIIWP